MPLFMETGNDKFMLVVDDVSDELWSSQLVDTLKLNQNHNEFGSCESVASTCFYLIVRYYWCLSSFSFLFLLPWVFTNMTSLSTIPFIRHRKYT